MTTRMGLAFWRFTRALFSGRCLRSVLPGFVELERVGQADAVEGQVVGLALASPQAVEGFLDVDGGDVVGQQDDLVGVQFVLVLVRAVRPAG